MGLDAIYHSVSVLEVVNKIVKYMFLSYYD